MRFKWAGVVVGVTCVLMTAPAVAAPITSGSAGAGGGGNSTPEPGAPGGDSAASLRAQVLDLVNTERARNGCGALRESGQLRTAAQRHSDDMAARGYFDHTNPDGAGPGDRITAAGYRWRAYGENIAKGQQDARSVMTAWMNSSGHRANILNCTFTELGVEVRLGSGGPWWTQNFGTPA